MGACGDAPVMLVNNHSMCSFMTEEAIDKKLAETEIKGRLKLFDKEGFKL